MLRRTALVILLLQSATALAANVTTAEARKLTLLEYVADRSDLNAEERREWDKALRAAFGGAAMKDGTDEGVTVAKSVVAAAIFFDIEPKKAARAAFDAYHDTFRWVPPPIAINYQILVMQGRKPKADPRELAFDFPRYFNADIAPDLVVWWDEMLAAGKIPAFERKEVEEALRETRALMRPMLRARLWNAVELDSRLKWLQASGTSGKELADVKKGIAEIDLELGRDFKAVGTNPRIGDARESYYERYAALSKELNETPKPRPSYPGPVAPRKAEPQPEAKRPPVPPKPELPAPSTTPEGTPQPKPEVRPQPQAVIVEAKEAEVAERKAERNAGRVPAPLPPDPLVPVFPGFEGALNATVDRWVGTPYLWGGVDHHGIDCSGFARQVFRETFNIELPRNSRAQFSTGVRVERHELEPGDLLFFDTMDRGTVTHVGVYVGDGIFAQSASHGVGRSELAKRYNQHAYYGSRRVLKH